MANKMTGKVVVVTGASSGIGEATAKRLAEDGAVVVLAARRLDRLEKIKKEIESKDGRAFIFKVDVTKKEEVDSFVAETLRQLGRIDVLVNNAGIMPLSMMQNLRVTEWDRTIDVNIKGVLYGIAAVLPVFRKQKSGHIVNIASVGGRRVYAGCAVYCATKFAVRAISEGLRQELDPSEKIRVTVIEPGAVATELPSSIHDEDQKERLKQFSKAITFLEAEDIAESIYYAVSQKDRVNVDEILIMPQEQGH